jgi:hypothetical protein
MTIATGCEDWFDYVETNARAEREAEEQLRRERFGEMPMQRDMFETWAALDRVPVRDPNVMEGDEPRLSGQNAAILERLKQGPATNVELAGISLKYTSRISDLRAAGYRVTCRRGNDGVNTYALD